MAVAQTLTGARTVFTWNGQTVGWASAMSGEENIEYAPIEVLNLLEVREHVPVAYRCSFNASMFRRLGAHARNRPQTATNKRIMPLQDEILATEGVTAIAQLGDGAGQTVAAEAEQNLYIFNHAKCQSRAFDIPARGAVVENMSFVAIRLENQAGVTPSAEATNFRSATSE